MDSLRIDRSGYTLVDQVEEKLIQYFKEQGLRPGSSIPNENELAASLGIGRTVLREALSRFKMTGMIQSRTKRGMTLAEPSLLASLRRSMNPLLMSETTLRDIFEMRIILELGSADLVINLLSPQDIAELEQLVENEERFGDPYLTGFHRKLYENMGNKMMTNSRRSSFPYSNMSWNNTSPCSRRAGPNSRRKANWSRTATCWNASRPATRKATKRH